MKESTDRVRKKVNLLGKLIELGGSMMSKPIRQGIKGEKSIVKKRDDFGTLRD